MESMEKFLKYRDTSDIYQEVSLKIINDINFHTFSKILNTFSVSFDLARVSIENNRQRRKGY